MATQICNSTPVNQSVDCFSLLRRMPCDLMCDSPPPHPTLSYPCSAVTVRRAPPQGRLPSRRGLFSCRSHRSPHYTPCPQSSETLHSKAADNTCHADIRLGTLHFIHLQPICRLSNMHKPQCPSSDLRGMPTACFSNVIAAQGFHSQFPFKHTSGRSTCSAHPILVNRW